MTDNKRDGGLGGKTEIRYHADAVWTLLCECLEGKVAEFTAENTNVRASVEPGVAIGLVKVRAFGGDVSAQLGFELAMNTAGLNGWVRRDMTRMDLPILMTLERSGPSYRFGEEVVSVPALVDRGSNTGAKNLSLASRLGRRLPLQPANMVRLREASRVYTMATQVGQA